MRIFLKITNQLQDFFLNLISQNFHMQTLWMKTILSWFVINQQFGEAEKGPYIHLKLLDLIGWQRTVFSTSMNYRFH